MKMKRFIAVAIAAMMSLASVAANAALYVDGDGWLMTNSYPTEAEIAARQVIVTAKVEALTLADAVATGKIGSKGKTEENTDCYKVTYTVSGIGDLYRACYDEDPWNKYVEVRLYNIRIVLPTFTAKQYGLLSGSLDGTSFANSNMDTIMWTAPSEAASYPASDALEGLRIEGTTAEAVVVYALNEGATVDVEPSVSATYRVTLETGAKAVDAIGTAANHVVMAPAAPATTYTITFKTYDGSANVNSTEYNENDAVTAPSAPVRSGYTFSHWSETQGGAAATVLTTATADKTYYAVYTKDPVITDSSIDVKKPISGTKGLTDLQGREVTLTKNYGIAKFSKEIDTTANNYFLAVEAENGEKDDLAIDFDLKGVEISNASTTFFAIVRSSTRVIKSIQLKEVAK